MYDEIILSKLENKFIYTKADKKYYNGKKRILKEQKTLNKLYFKIIRNLKKLLVELQIIEPLEIFYAFCYIYKKGFLSDNNIFTYYDDQDDFRWLYGLSVINGYGVCRNIASMLNDLYKEFGYQSELVAALYGNEKNIKSFKDVLKKYFGDHVIVSVKKDNKNYIFDPTNKMVLKPSGKNKIIEYVFDQDECMKYLRNSISYKKMIKVLYVDSETCELSYLETDEKLFYHNDELTSFYEDNAKTYKKIAHKMNCSLYKRLYTKK